MGKQYYEPASYYAFVFYTDAGGKKKRARLFLSVKQSRVEASYVMPRKKCLVDVGAKRRKYFALISGFQLDFCRVALYFNRRTKGL